MELYRVESLTFTYPGQSAPALRDVSLTLCAGEFVTLCGLSGSGKSTLTKLLIGFYTPTGGEVELKIGNKTVHGAEIRNYLSYDSGFVSVFAGTLKENVCMDQPFDEKKFRKAVDLANLTEFVNEKTAEYEIEPEGKNLSSGQRRKVALAKELLRETNKSITQIAEEAGYINISNFIAVFKRMEGVTPSVYRQHMYK